MQTLWWIIGIFVGLFLFYSVVPNLLTRVFHLSVMTRLGDKRLVALTFDDGPDPAYTPQLLDALSHHQIKATFFVLAEKAVRNPDIIQRMIRDGHEIQIHGYSHLLVPFLFPGAAIKQVRFSAEELKKRFGLHASYYRPTWGLLNLPSFLFVLTRSQYRLVIWSIMVGDWRNVAASELLERIRVRLHPGAILVLHDSDVTFGAQEGSPNQVIQLIPDLARLVRTEGYQFSTLEGRL